MKMNQRHKKVIKFIFVVFIMFKSAKTTNSLLIFFPFSLNCTFCLQEIKPQKCQKTKLFLST